MLEGIDVSHWQGLIDWATVKPYIRFAILKCTEGVSYVDDTYPVNKQGCIDNGIPHGAYHFFRSSADPIEQAEHFAGHVGANMKMLVCDVETNDGGDLKANLRAFMERLEDITGVRPWIYTGPAFWRTYGIHDEQWCAYYPLWIANYGVQQPNVPPGWTSWKMWQYSDKGVVPGIPGNSVDMNVFNGTEAELSQAFGNGEAVPIPAPDMPDHVRVIADVLNVRSTPGGVKVGYVNKGTQFVVIGHGHDNKGNEWYKVGPNSYVASWWVESVTG